MIKITVNPLHEPKSYSFDLPIVVIGEGSPDTVDICFPAEGLHQNHLKILLKEDGYWVLNQANDPFVTLNGQPFGKKKLQTGDHLHIRDHILHIDDIRLSPVLASPPNEESVSPPVISSEENLTDFPDVEDLANDENPEAWFPANLNQLKESAPPSAGANPEFTEKINPLIEEAYNLEEQKTRYTTTLQPPSKTNHNWKRKLVKAAIVFAFLLLVAIGAFLTELYLQAQSKNLKEEMLAAENLADYAMALTYAKVYHISAQKHNLVDPQSIKTNMIDMLSATSIPCGNIDAQGQFSNCPYILRFYTNRDFSRFLLIAQPAPTLSQWLLPKKTMLVDSSIMEIRKTDDLRVLNRLLSYPTPLDGTNGEELLNEINKTETLYLRTLAKHTGKKEFIPPIALSYMLPGAENLIYNAPRYYQFGNTFLQKILSIEHPENRENVTLFQNEIDALSKFKNLVYYSTGGVHQALQAYRSLKKLAFSNNFLTAYLLHNSTGDIINSHIILDNNPTSTKVHEEENEIAIENIPALKSDYIEDEVTRVLREKAEKAHQTLNPLLQNMHRILSDILEKDSLYLNHTFFQLLASYEREKEKARVDIEKALQLLRQTHHKLNALNVDRLLREYSILDLYQEISLTKKELKKEEIAFLQGSSILPYSFLEHKEEKTTSSYERWNSIKALFDLAEIR